MSTRPERVELILAALMANDGEDRLALAAAINDALEPTLFEDDAEARKAWLEKTSNIIAIGVVLVGAAILLALLALGAAWVIAEWWPS